MSNTIWQRRGPSSSRFQPQRFAGQTSFNLKWTLQQGVHFLTPFWNTFPFHGDPKLDSQQIESGASLEVRFWVHPSTVFTCTVHKTNTNKGLEQGRLQFFEGCCFFPLRKCIFSVAATFWVAKLDFLCCWFFSCLGRFFSCLGRVFSRLGRVFSRCLQNAFFCCKGAFVLLQGVFSAALNFSRCEAAFFAGVFSRCGNSFFPLQGVFFLLPNVFFSVPMFFPCCDPVFFARCAKTRS